MIKYALITGVPGQDGSYLAEFLLEKNYEVHGIKRRWSSFNTDRIDHLCQDPHEQDRHLILHNGDLTNSTNLVRIMQQVQPDEIFNLIVQSHVAVSFESPEFSANSDARGLLGELIIFSHAAESKEYAIRSVIGGQESTDDASKPVADTREIAARQ